MSIYVSSYRSSLEDEDCPDYNEVVCDGSKRMPSTTTTHRDSEAYNPIDESLRPISNLNVGRRLGRPSTRHERYIYTYRLLANAPMQFMVSVEPLNGRPIPGKYTFRLSLKTNGIERTLCEPTTRILSVDPRQLEFVVFIFPGKQSLPVGCLWSLRVWLRVNGIDHRIFGEDELWVGRDPDFNSITDASFARMMSMEADRQVYNIYVGKALVTFIVKWKSIGANWYKYSMGYEASGVGDLLFDDVRLRLDEDPQTISFVIFSLPSTSIPPGASHKIRIWIRSPVPLSSSVPQGAGYNLPFNDSYVYQRIYKTDTFKIGGRLDFESLGVKMITGFLVGGPETMVTSIPRNTHAPSASFDITNAAAKEKRQDYAYDV